MDQLLGQTRLRLVDVLTLGRGRDLVVVDDRDPHAWCIALDVPYHGRALQDQRAADNVGWRKDKQIWPPGGGFSFICEERPVTDQPHVRLVHAVDHLDRGGRLPDTRV